jgi:hypothetical protein
LSGASSSPLGSQKKKGHVTHTKEVFLETMAVAIYKMIKKENCQI